MLAIKTNILMCFQRLQQVYILSFYLAFKLSPKGQMYVVERNNITRLLISSHMYRDRTRKCPYTITKSEKMRDVVKGNTFNVL